MSSAKDEILRRIRTALQDVPDGDPADDTPVAWRYGQPTRTEGVLDVFVDRVEDYKATVVRCTTDEVPGRIADALTSRGAASVVLPAAIDATWRAAIDAAGLDVRDDEPRLTRAELDATDAVVTASCVAAAESGTIMLDHRGDQGRRALSLVPDLHVCVVRADQVVSDVPEAVAAIAPSVRDHRLPSTWISGGSATSDIELSRVEGVHGPRTLVVILVDSAGEPRPLDARTAASGDRFSTTGSTSEDEGRVMSSSRIDPDQDPQTPHSDEADRRPVADAERDALRSGEDRDREADRTDRDFDDRADEVEERLDRLDDDDRQADRGSETGRGDRRDADGERQGTQTVDADRGGDDANRSETFRAERPEDDHRSDQARRDATADGDRRSDDHRTDDHRTDDHRKDERGSNERGSEEAVGVERSEHTAGEERADTSIDTDGEDGGSDDGDEDAREAEEARRRAEEFAREHDPANHDISAGEEFRQRGDVVVDGDRAKVMDEEGNYRDAGDPQTVSEGTVIPGESDSGRSPSDDGSGGSSDERRSHDESSGGGSGEGLSRDGGSDETGRENIGEDTGSSGEGLTFGGVDQDGSSDDAPDGRRVSEYDEVRDGGYGVGSACPIDDGAMPLGHPVKGWNDTKTFVDTDHSRYADAEPHVWFIDADAAQRAGFQRAGD